MSAESIAEAGRQVDERAKAGTCPPLTLASYPMNMRALGEFYNERDARQREQEAASPAA